MTFNVTLPSLLSRLGWRLELVGVGDGFTLASGAKREVFIKLHPGQALHARRRGGDARPGHPDRRPGQRQPDRRHDLPARPGPLAAMERRAAERTRAASTRPNVWRSAWASSRRSECLREGDRREHEGQERRLLLTADRRYEH